MMGYFTPKEMKGWYRKTPEKKRRVVRIGKQMIDKSINIYSSTWGGKTPVRVIAPKRPTKIEKRKVQAFFHQADDIYGYELYEKRIRRRR